jgi:Rab-GTPase-TBC domain
VRTILDRYLDPFPLLTSLSSAYRYITATMLEHRVKIFSFQDLVFLVMPATYQCLMTLKALTDEFLNNIFVGLFFSLLPKEQAYRILDSFLLEGGKILYRYGIALISMFKVSIKANKYETGEQFWSDVATTCNAESFNFDELHSLAFDKTSKSFLRMLSRKRKINRRNICELKNQIRVPLEKSMAGTKNSSGTLKLATDICILAAVSTWFDKELWAQSSILDVAMAIKLQLYLTEAMQQHPLSDAETYVETER